MNIAEELESLTTYANPDRYLYLCSACGFKTQSPKLTHNARFPNNPLAMITTCPKCGSQRMVAGRPEIIPGTPTTKREEVEAPITKPPSPKPRTPETLYNFLVRCHPEILQEWKTYGGSTLTVTK